MKVREAPVASLKTLLNTGSVHGCLFLALAHLVHAVLNTV
jgi:hypothetical protein